MNARTGNAALIARTVAQALDTSLAREHPLTLFGIDALVAGAARPRPRALAFADHHAGAQDKVSYADLYQRVGACLARLRSFQLSAGERRVMICAPAGAQSFVVLAAALGAGLEPVLAPMLLPATMQNVAHAARECHAAAIFAPAQFCGVDFEESLLTLAAETPSIRFIGALSGTLDGAADFTPAMLGAPLSPRARILDEWPETELQMQIGALDDMGHVAFQPQGALLDAALDLVRAMRRAEVAHAARETPILSLAAPSGFGALVAGPLAALIAGAPLHFLTPFVAADFLAMLDTLGSCRLVAPATIVTDLARAGVLSDGSVLAVTALAHEHAPPTSIDRNGLCPVVELRMTTHGVQISPY